MNNNDNFCHMNAHVSEWREWRSQSWIFGESVKEWLYRRLHLSKRGNTSKLVEWGRVDPATIYRLKDKESFDFTINRDSVRNALAKYKFINESTGEESELGLYGYPPVIKPTSNKDIPFAIKKIKAFSLKLEDFKQVLTESEKVNCDCDFCKPNHERFQEVNLGYDNYETIVNLEIANLDHDDEKSDEKNYAKRIFVTSHSSKQYGAIHNRPLKNFTIDLFICDECSNLRTCQELLINPISDLIQKIKDKYKLTQTEIAHELSIKQSTLSKLERDAINFINPLIVKKLYGFYLLGSLLNKDSHFYSGEARENFLTEIRMKGYEKKHFTENKALVISPSKYVERYAGKSAIESTIKVKCDLFILNDHEDIGIACYYDPHLHIRNVQMLIAYASNLGATHICLISSSLYKKNGGFWCLDIRHGYYKTCDVPFNKTFLLVRNIDDKHKYKELDASLNPGLLNDVEFLLSLKRAYPRYSYPQEEFEQQFELLDPSDDVDGYLNKDKTGAITQDEINKGYIDIYNDIRETTACFFDSNEEFNDLIINFQVSICVAIENNERTKEELCQIYNIDPGIIYAWQSTRQNDIYDFLEQQKNS